MLIKVSDRTLDHQSEAKREESVIKLQDRVKGTKEERKRALLPKRLTCYLSKQLYMITLCNFVVPTCSV